MKKFRLLSVLAFTLIIASCNAQEKSKNLTSDQASSKIEVIDFHTTHRCMTCNAIEANTRYTLNTYFSKEVEEGKITFQLINIDEKKNEQIAEKFEAAGTSLFLNVIVNGEETQVDLTEFAFMSGNDKEEFSQELKAKLDSELKKL